MLNFRSDEGPVETGPLADYTTRMVIQLIVRAQLGEESSCFEYLRYMTDEKAHQDLSLT